MKKIIGFLFCIVFLVGCAEDSQYQKATDKDAYQVCDGFVFNDLKNWEKNRIITVSFFGFNTQQDKNSNVLINEVADNQLKIILKPKDTLVSVNTTDITSREQYVDLVIATKTGSLCNFTFQRGTEKPFSIKIISGRNEYACWLDFIFSRIAEQNNKINLAIIVSSDRIDDKDAYTAIYEKKYLEFFYYYKDFSIVDRVSVEKIIAEQKFSLSGAIDEKTRLEIGKLTGATHILFFTVHRYGNGWGNTERLIDLKTGKVLASDTYTQPYN